MSPLSRWLGTTLLVAVVVLAAGLALQARWDAQCRAVEPGTRWDGNIWACEPAPNSR